MVLVNGTDHGSLMKGPGRDLRTYMPGHNRLTYIAGHRTTYLAPFSHIDAIELQACHPRFFATHRYVVYAYLVAVRPRGGTPCSVRPAVLSRA